MTDDGSPEGAHRVAIPLEQMSASPFFVGRSVLWCGRADEEGRSHRSCRLRTRRTPFSAHGWRTSTSPTMPYSWWRGRWQAVRSPPGSSKS